MHIVSCLLRKSAPKNDKEGELIRQPKEKLDPVGSTVRYEMMKLCTGSV